MDKALLYKIEQAVDLLLLKLIRSTVSAGMTPISAISMVRERLDLIETMAREEGHEAVADVLVPGVGDDRSQAEAWMEALHPEATSRINSGDRGGQTANPRRSEAQPDNQADWNDGQPPVNPGSWH